MADIKMLYGSVSNYPETRQTDDTGKLFFANDSSNKKSYLYLDDGTYRLNIVPRLLSVVNGGTGATTFTQYGILYGDGTNAIKTTAKGTQGQILSPNSSGIPSFATPSFSWPNNNNTDTHPFLRMTI